MDLSPTERDCLAVLLLVGDSTPQAISDEIGRHPSSIGRSLADLIDHGLVVKRRETAVYSLSVDGMAVAMRLLKTVENEES